MPVVFVFFEKQIFKSNSTGGKMKSICLVKSILILSGILALWNLAASSVTKESGIVFENGSVRLEKNGTKAWKEDFSGKAHCMEFAMNYYNRMKCAVKTSDGKNALYVTSKMFKDQAWGLRTPLIPVKAGDDFAFSFEVAGTVSMLKGAGRKNYSNRYFFFDKDKKGVADDTYFYYESQSPIFLAHTITGKVPEDAAFMVIQFGGAPRMKTTDFLAYRSLNLTLAGKNASYVKKGSFLSRPILITGNTLLSMKGKVPANCAVSFEIQTAKDRKGSNFKWGEWKKYTNNTKVGNAGEYLRYRAILTGNGKNTPILDEVIAGDFKDSSWNVKTDQLPPSVTRITSSPVADGKLEVRFLISDETMPDFATIKCALNKKDITKKLTRNGYVLTYKPDTPLKGGRNDFHFTIQDIYGNKHDIRECVFIGKPFTGNKVTYRKDGLMLVNGEEFFPIGFYSSKAFAVKDNADPLMKQLADNGVNFLQSYLGAKAIPPFLAAAEKYNIKTCIRYWLYQYSTHKTVIGLFIADDSNRFTPSAIRSLSNETKAVAPGLFGTHTVWPLQSYNSLYYPRVQSADVFMPQLYPISDKWASIRNGPQRVITDMQTCIRDRAAQGRPQQSVIPLLQTFKSLPQWTRGPTKDELRLMTYLTIIHGANGVVYFSHGGAKALGEDYLKMVLTITKELKDLYPVLLAEKKEKKPSVKILSGAELDRDKNFSINVLVKKVGKYKYIIAANSAKEEVKAEFANMGKGTAEVMFEKRNVAFDGSLQDTFAPYAVHIYKIAEK